MNNQEKQELNEKIARFSGFMHIKQMRHYPMSGDKDVYRWYSPEGTECTPPDFLDPIKGLGLMFKYPVALLDPKEYHVGLIRMIGTYEWQGFITHLVNDADEMDDIWEGMDDDPTTALALAIGKLIDSIEKGGSGITT